MANYILKTAQTTFRYPDMALEYAYNSLYSINLYFPFNETTTFYKGHTMFTIISKFEFRC